MPCALILFEDKVIDRIFAFEYHYPEKEEEKKEIINTPRLESGGNDEAVQAFNATVI